MIALKHTALHALGALIAAIHLSLLQGIQP